jgi:uncharacterized protein YyaL (SSP411 family)
VSKPGELNRLAHESSPYLQQHASNPVDWYPWGEEALARARGEEKPIFLSIGYAACHWCHVMERESFEDPAIAAQLNAGFVPIKVDREERPDLDAVYMAAVQALTGSGGWPLSVFLTPDLHPFFGGTYYPPAPRFGMPSFREVLAAVSEAWATRRHEVESAAAQITARLALRRTPDKGERLATPQASRQAIAALASEFDARHGGFGSAPKFPTPSRLFFLLPHTEVSEEAREMLSLTLDGMAAGGMYDWLGGGFHRYSTDRQWLVPHFEKMLYDNALLARAYGEAGVLLQRSDWVAVARATADYLLREMRGPEGAFFSSTDADSEGHEGKYFTWTPDQVREALPGRQADLVIALCGLRAAGNFEGGASVLRPVRPLREVAAELAVSLRDAAPMLADAREELLGVRAARVAPATDDKRLAAWNGMAVWALAWLGAALPAPRYLDAARQTAAFLLDRREGNGRLVRSWRDGRASGTETLEDVAWVSAGLVQLYESDGNVRWLNAARDLVEHRLPHYHDGEGAVFDTPDDGPPLVVRPHDPTDGATPSAVGVVAATLLRIASLTGDESLHDLATRAIDSESSLVARIPAATTTLLAAIETACRPPATLVVVGNPSWESTHRLLRAAWCHKPAACALALSPTVPVPVEVTRTVPLFAGREGAGAEPALAYVCEGGRCSLPLSDPTALAASLSAIARSRR